MNLKYLQIAAIICIYLGSSCNSGEPNASATVAPAASSAPAAPAETAGQAAPAPSEPPTATLSPAPPSADPSSQASAIKTGDDSISAADTIAVYEGIIPCADCPGIKTRLALTNKESYFLRETYLERKVSPLLSTGSFNTLRGFEKDDDATVYVLNDTIPGKERYFVRLTGKPGELRMLDNNQKLIDSKLNYTLKKK